MKHINFKFFIALMACLYASFCSAEALDSFKGQKGTLKIAGGTAHIPVVKEAARRIMSRYKNITITVTGGGSGLGIKQVGEGLVNIGNSGRKPKQEEIKRYKLVMHKWAIDGVGIVVNPQNKVKALTKEQLKAIYSGAIKNWLSLGGADHSIAVYTRDESSGTRSVFWKKALDKGDVKSSALFVPSNGAMKSAVGNDPYAIGYISVGHIDKTVSPVTFDGIEPSLKNVQKGSYKIARGLFSNTRGNPQGLTKLFVDYLFTSEGQKIVADKGFIPVK